MTEPVYTLAASNAGVRALIGNPARMFPSVLPQTVVLPAVVYHTISGMPENVMGDSPRADHERVQVDCWAMDYDTAAAVFDAVRVALDDITAQEVLGVGVRCIASRRNDYEPDTKRFRVSGDFSIWKASPGASADFAIDGGDPATQFNTSFDGGSP